ncbi:MAG TPA: 30S ribosomal protein S6 [Anaerolineae bacterium]|nr:30S ribosomal protein S6 [Anaerolineae bacterium]
MANYELTYILRPLEEANLTAANDRIATTLRNAGGEIVARHDWGRRRLAYPIRKINDGYYTTLYITLPGNAVRGIERSLQLSDDVLRYLVVHVETHRLPTAPAPTPAPALEAPSAPAETAPEAAETPAASTAQETTQPTAAPAEAQEVAPAATTEGS